MRLSTVNRGPARQSPQARFPIPPYRSPVALKLSDGTLQVYSEIGTGRGDGLMTKHGIPPVVDFANQRVESGMAATRIAVDAFALRLSPMVMSSLTMILGALPSVMASGAGEESRAQVGWVIVGGMTLGTFLTIVVIPSVCVSLARIRRHQIVVKNA
jgi:multidrug efflux pump